MSYFQLIGRLLMNFAGNPAVQDALRAAGSYAIRQGTAALVRAVRNRNPKIEMKRVK